MSSEQAPNPRDAIRGTTRVIAKAIATADGVPERFVQDEAFDNAVEAVVRAVEALRVGWERDARQAERDRHEKVRRAWQLRMRVGQWWRIKIAQDNMDTSMYRSVLGDQYDRVMRQIAADIEHSDLLTRLLGGDEPRPDGGE